MFFCFSTPQQNRHPERSAAQIYPSRRLYGAESKDLGGAYFTHAARSFSTTEARAQDRLRYAVDGRAEHDAGKFLVLGPGKDRGGFARFRLPRLKSSEPHRPTSIAEVLRLRAASAVSGDESVAALRFTASLPQPSTEERREPQVVCHFLFPASEIVLIMVIMYRSTMVQMTGPIEVERIQTGVRMEKRLLKVLKAVAELKDMTLGDLLEGIVLHAFEGKSAFSAQTLKEIEQFRNIYGLTLHASDSHRLKERK
jgi:hypothetical protein